jgi:hypothetical protein
VVELLRLAVLVELLQWPGPCHMEAQAGAGTDNKMYFFQLQKEPEGSFCF